MEGPSVPLAIQEWLARRDNPRLRLIWDGRRNRWVIYFALDTSRWKPHRRDIYERDGTIWRVLQTWAERDSRFNDIGYAPLDSRFIHVMEEGDSWGRKHDFAKAADERDQKIEDDLVRGAVDAQVESAKYYRKMDSLTIAPYIKGGGDWRHRIR